MKLIFTFLRWHYRTWQNFTGCDKIVSLQHNWSNFSGNDCLISPQVTARNITWKYIYNNKQKKNKCDYLFQVICAIFQNLSSRAELLSCTSFYSVYCCYDSKYTTTWYLCWKQAWHSKTRIIYNIMLFHFVL